MCHPHSAPMIPAYCHLKQDDASIYTCTCVTVKCGCAVVLLTLGAHAQRGLQYLVCHSVCHSVCLSGHAILAVRVIKSIMKDTIVLSVRFAAILKWRFS